MTKIKHLFAFITAVSMLLALTACSGDNDFPVKIANYTFDEKPDSIVCLSDSVADILITCGYADKITARSDECTQEELQNLPSVGSRNRPNSQKILSVSPDVVFADKSFDPETKKKIEDANIKVLTMASAKTSDELISLYKSICTVAGGKETGKNTGETKANSILDSLNDLQRLANANNNESEITACYLYDISGTAATNDTLSGKLLEYANTINVCPSSSSSNIRAVRLSNPQYIFCAIGVKEQLLADDDLKNLTAVKNGSVFEINALAVQRQGGSLVEVLTFMVDAIYSDSNENSIEESSQPEPSQESSKEESQIKVEADHSLVITEDMYYELGDESDAIVNIQNRLKTLGYFDEDATGYFGELSVKALMNFEKTNSLEPDGIASYEDLVLMFSADAKPKGSTQENSKQESSKQENSKQESSKQESSKQESSTPQGSITVKADNSLEINEYTAFGFGDNDEEFKKVQKRLKDLGYYNDDITGYYGEVTLKAFNAFEKNNGLDQDGYASPEDLTLLFSADVKAAR